MQAGVIGIPVEGSIEAVEDLQDSYYEGNDEYQMALDVQWQVKSFTPRFPHVHGGRAYLEYATEVEEWRLVDGEVLRDEFVDVEKAVSDFAIVPASDEGAGLVLTGNKDGTFLYGLMEQLPGTPTIERAELDLQGIRKDIEPLDTWKIGFEERPDHAESGTLYGDQIPADDKIGRDLLRVPWTQYGVVMEFEGEELKVDLSKGGSVRVLSPAEFETAEYVDFLARVIMPHVYEDVAEGVDLSTKSLPESRARSGGSDD